MIVNAWEWVEDGYHDSYVGAPVDGSAWTGGDCGKRVLRGGPWYFGPGSARSANRGGLGTTDRDGSIGFRPARIVSP